MNRVYRILSNSYGLGSKKEKQIPKTPSNVLSHSSVETKIEEKVSDNDQDTIELAALSPRSRGEAKARTLVVVDENDDREVHFEEWICLLDLMRVSKIRRCPTQLLQVVFKMFSSKKDNKRDATLNLNEFKAALSLATELEVRRDSSQDNKRLNRVTVDKKLTFRDCCRGGIENETLKNVVEAPCWRHFWNILLALYCVLQFLNYEVDSRNIDDANAIDTITSIMLFSFVLEIAVSMLAIGVIGLWRRSAFDRIDIVLVLTGTIGEIIGMSIDSSSTLVVDILPLLRVIRILRLLRISMNFRIVVGVLFRIGGQLARYVCVLFLLFYFYAALGMELFAYKLDEDIASLRNTSYVIFRSDSFF